MPCPGCHVLSFRYRASEALRVRMQSDFALLGRSDLLSDEEFFLALERLVPQWTCDMPRR